METEIDASQLRAGKRRSNNNSDDGVIPIKQPKLDKNFECEKRRQNINDSKESEEIVPSNELSISKSLVNPSTSCRPKGSPKKRLQVPSKEGKSKEKFIYGNYSHYYGYRNKDFQDVRLEIFEARRQLFENKQILDIGCNNGFITENVAKRFHVKSIIGIDIDRTLINQAIKNLIKAKKSLPMENEARKLGNYPFNVRYIHGNYVLKNDVLLEIEHPQFDLILCLSITKWIQLNFGDNGLKQAFRRIYLQLHDGGRLILEAQPLKNYKKRKNLSDDARSNFNAMKFFPEQFTEYLLNEVGFKRMELLGVPEDCSEGFKRPIQVFFKD